MSKRDKIDQILTQLAVMNERDVNTAKDIEAIYTTLSIVVERSQKHDQTLYGETGKNGLVGNNKLLMRAFYAANTAVALLGAAFALFKDQIRGFIQTILTGKP